jgi:hypothetical protein
LSITIDKTTKQKGEKMKVSKIILASMLGAAILGSAGADEYDGPRNRCKARTDWYWVENTKTCVPKNPCKDEKYEKYCIRDFRDVEVNGLTKAVKLAEYYLKFKGLENVNCLKDQTGEEKGGRQNYIACTAAGGSRYVVFEFDDTTNNEIDNSETMEEYNEARNILCNALGGQKLGAYCQGITEENCNKLVDAVKDVYGAHGIHGGDRTPEYEAGNGCKIVMEYSKF